MLRSISTLSFTLVVALSVGPARAQESALPSLRSAARAAPRDYDAQLALGRALIEAGRHAEAAQTLRRAARLRRNDPQALYEVARVSFAQRNYRQARGQCRQVRRAATDSALGHVCMARTWLALRRSSRAFEALEQALEAAPNDFEALLALGDAHRQRASVAESENAYQRAIAVDGRRAEPHLGLGQLYAQAGRRDDALTALRRAHELAPNDPDVDFELGRLARGRAAITHLRDAVSNRPEWPLAHATLGDALLGAGQHGEAAGAYRRAIEGDSNLSQARAGLGRALIAAGELEQAEAMLREAIEQVPSDAESAMALAEVYARTDRQEEAYEQYRHAADLDSTNAEPLLRAARLALSQERPVLAVGFLQRVLSTAPNSAAALGLMGDVMRARRQTRQARSYYQRALEGEGEVDRERIQGALRELR